MSDSEKIEDCSKSPQQLRVQAIHHHDGRRSCNARRTALRQGIGEAEWLAGAVPFPAGPTVRRLAVALEVPLGVLAERAEQLEAQ